MSQDPKSRGLIYAARMRYLQSREGRRSGLRLTGDGTGRDDDHLYLAKREPCDPGVLTPPPEVTTRSQAFKRAYWRYHRKPMVQSIEKSFPPSPQKGKELKDERGERLSGKRVEILARVRSGCGRQAVMTRRAGMALRGQAYGGIELNGSSNSGMESEESGDEHESELEEQLGRITLLATSPPHQPGGASPGRTNTKSSSLDFTPRTSDDARKNRRTTTHAEEEIARCENQADENTPLHDAKQAGETGRKDDAGRCRRTVNQPKKDSQRTGGGKREDSAFSFLSEWKIEPPKKRW